MFQWSVYSVYYTLLMAEFYNASLGDSLAESLWRFCRIATGLTVVAGLNLVGSRNLSGSTSRNRFPHDPVPESGI